MTARGKRLIIALLMVQGLAFGTWRLVQRGRTRPPEIVVERPDGTPAPLHAAGRKTLLHFWATWCEPCRAELPALLDYAARHAGELALVAVSVDDGWPAVRGFFAGGAIPPEVVRARRSDAHRLYGARSLPQSFILDGDGGVVERLPGAQDWRAR